MQRWWLRASVRAIVIAERLVLGEQRARCHEQKFFERGQRCQLRRERECGDREDFASRLRFNSLRARRQRVARDTLSTNSSKSLRDFRGLRVEGGA